jgi:UDP-N-acetyl-D-galactosamine dehydrogenase
MGAYVASQMVKLMLKKDIAIKGAKVLVLGFTFKENCPDVRNTKVADLVLSLQDYLMDVTVFDPHANPDEVQHEYQMEILNQLPENTYDGIILAVPHKEFHAIELDKLKKTSAAIFDIKAFLPREIVDARL